MKTDFRALCAELVAALCKYDLDTEEEVALLDQARTALAEPVKGGGRVLKIS
jgi:hypothetical protein